MAEVILVVGGAGYIGSHVCKALKKEGFLPVTFDNLSHGHQWAVRYGPLFCGDLNKESDLREVFDKYLPKAVIHLASYIHVRESLENPYKYYQNNFTGTLSLLNAMVRYQVHFIVFSSTAAVYGKPKYLPIDELHPQKPINPYGKSKWMVEQLLEDFHRAHGLHFLLLRYFNAAGADLEGEIGEAHSPETHLLPLVIQTALKIHPSLSIYGIDHPTEDGTAIRDYIHVADLASAHVTGLRWLQENQEPIALNLGTERGFSVQEIIRAVEKYSGQVLPVKISVRSPADPSILIANASRAKELLDWHPSHSSLETLIESAWNWHSKNQKPITCEKSR